MAPSRLSFHKLNSAFCPLLFVLLTTLGCSYSSRETVHGNEEVLKQDLSSVRIAIDQYTYDKNQAPQNLSDLIAAGYFKTVPIDPLTGSAKTWRVVRDSSGITDVHSGSDRISTQGTPYSAW